ncbi:MAG: hypothetical protein IRZ14_16335 [Chloroflexi bacterium]|nr:hypothetical protein [Chloroflexota bacterium]
MSEVRAPSASQDQARQQAREAVIQWLGLISMAIWVIGILAFMIWLYPARPLKPSSGMLAGLVMLGVAALPWLAYRPLVQRRLQAPRRQRPR